LNGSARSAIERRQPRPSGMEEALPIMSRRKPLAALAAVTAALAVAVPAGSASATATADQCTAAGLAPGSVGCASYLVGVAHARFCVFGGHVVEGLLRSGNVALASTVSVPLGYICPPG
jgi:hypothetical protein